MCFLQCAHFCSYRAVRDTGTGRHDHLHEEVPHNTAVGQPSCGLSLSDVCVCVRGVMHVCVPCARLCRACPQPGGTYFAARARQVESCMHAL